jgi:hypothetical protein
LPFRGVTVLDIFALHILILYWFRHATKCLFFYLYNRLRSGRLPGEKEISRKKETLNGEQNRTDKIYMLQPE